ncbi:MAG: preprotein translocase subunit SecE [Christensenellaceae bacterium]|nr:preprotein translocase subunit SecE [Christensenellaceae bacterium]
MWHELKKVSWPTRKELLNYTVIVLVFMVFMGIVIGLLDAGATQLINLIS